MDNRIEKVDKIFSFQPDHHASNYCLTEVEDSVKDQLINLTRKLEQIPQVYLCVRGASKKDNDSHNDFFDKDLSKIFIVGEKARSNISESSNTTYRHYNDNSSSTIKDIENLITEVNTIIKNKHISHNISGTIPQSFLDNLNILDSEQLGHWKIFLLSFLHNNGYKLFMNYSPFLSLSYGYEKYIIARQFALNRCSLRKGIIFLYCLNAGWPYYLKTIDFTNALKKLGVMWYKDIHNEIMLIDGMYPHYLIGIFEVESLRNPRFVLNPWLYQIFKNNENFDHTKGIKIDQTYFNSFAEKLGYKNFFFHYLNEGTEYVSEIKQYNHKKVYHS